MDIDFGAEAGQSYRTVQLSAKEVLAAGRRQHYCNMIDLLASSCKSSGLIATSFTDDELVEFWLGDILPLMFDADRKIQDCAVAALAEALVALDVSVIHSARCWPQIRTEFVNKYTTIIGEMRDAKNSNWHKIWTLLVQIMDEDLLRGCVYINKFLALVELGFRNPDNGVRSEAFLCWRVLIKIFAAYDELTSVKRLRLLLIPLRTSQSRSSHVSGIKLRVWWYLLTCLDQEIPKSFDSAVEHFLAFMLGGGPRNLPTGLAHNYQTARELALPCLVSLWGVEPSEPLQRLFRELRLETLVQPSPLMSGEVLQQHWKPLLSAAVSGLKLLSENDATEAEQLLLQLLVRNLCLAMFRLAVAPFNVACCSEIEKILQTETNSGGRVVRALFNTIAADSLVMERVAGSDQLDVLEAYLKLVLKSKTEVPAAILQRSIACIFAVDRIEASNQNEFRMLGSFAEFLMQNNDEEDFEGFAVKLQVWRQVSQALSNYLRNNALEYRVAHNASLLDTWLLWPLQTLAAFAGRRASNSFDVSFCDQWRQLVNAGQNAPGRKKFLTDLKATLTDLLKSKDEPHFAELFDAYVSSVIKLGLCKDAPLYKDVFGLLQTIFEQPSSQKTLEACLNTLRNLVVELRQNELMVVFDSLKPTLSSGIQCWNKLKCEGGFLEEWKRGIQEKFRKLPMKTMANQLKELFKGDDLFVIIPSVWSLNPEKLTDRQKERFAEKSDIPALYNDMSQSQDSASIKPWTPKKVVIAKSKQGELALTGKDDNDEVIDITPSEESEKEPVRVEVITPIRKKPGRKSQAQKDEEAAARAATLAEEPPKRQTRTRAAQKDTEQAAPERQLRSPKKLPPTPVVQSTAAAGKQTKVAKPTPVRKRVIFHDPPVSVTKEYLRDVEETCSSLKTKRCLFMDKVAQTTEMRQALRRRGRLDSIIEIERFASEQTARTATTDKSLDKSTGEAPEEDAFTSLKWNDTGNAHNISMSEEPVKAMEVESEPEPAGQDLAIIDPEAALDLVVEQLPLESVLQRYFDKNPLKSAGTLSKFLSAQMGANDKLKTNVLETLSENHSKDFLDHAVRENLSSVVCDRLNPNSVLEYVCAKSKISNSCRNGLLAQVPEILKSGPRSDAERLAFVQQLMVQCSPGDDLLLDLIDLLMRTRRERNSSSTSTSTHISKGVVSATGSPDNVAETAADSSSNL
ncbi:uncharacterized protein Dyak_GE14124 [Drosophila yakuba]|uniref:Telomere-associated protein Rif1 N-terminal domain-containing protein n=1 Tax=Drosophila yakuba TaxID=7245 RepID=B4P6V0_DROYA|nr:uncharacterized protein Dyak_GE14124 [Drosophila yakuba]